MVSKSAPGPSQPTATSNSIWKYAPFAFETHDDDAGSLSVVPSAHLAIRQHEHAALSDEEIGGFQDVDVEVSRHAAIQRKQPLLNSVSTKLSPLKHVSSSHAFQMVAILPNATIEGDSVIPAPTKKPRAPRGHVSATVSRALFALDTWVQDTVLTKIVPSLVDYYGSQENPWDLDGETRTEFGKKLNGILTKLHPNRAPHDVKPGDKLWRFVSLHILCFELSTRRSRIHPSRHVSKSTIGEATLESWPSRSPRLKLSNVPTSTARPLPRTGWLTPWLRVVRPRTVRQMSMYVLGHEPITEVPSY